MEEVVTLLESVEEVLIAVDRNSRDIAQLLDVFLILLRLLDHHSLVRSPGRKNLHSERILIDLLVIFERICRIVCCTYDLYIESLHQLLSSVFLCLKLCSTLVIDRASCLRIEEVIDAENSCELEVSPVIERIPHGVRHCLRPFLEFLIAVASAGYELFRYTVSAHRSPLVVVSSEPYFSEVLELMVICNHLWHEVAVVVDDRHLLCTLVIELTREVVGEHKVFVDEWFHMLFCI